MGMQPYRERAQVNETAPGTTDQDSRGQRVSRAPAGGFDAVGAALAAAGFLGAILLVLSDFMTLFDVTTAAGVTVPGGTIKGHSNHSFAMLIVGLAALPMAYGATAGRSRPAMVGLAVLGVIAALIALAVDLPDATGTNTLAKTFESAHATARTGFYLETLGAVLLVFAGGAGLLLSAPGRGGRTT
jgi:hypothetical protein